MPLRRLPEERAKEIPSQVKRIQEALANGDCAGVQELIRALPGEKRTEEAESESKAVHAEVGRRVMAESPDAFVQFVKRMDASGQSANAGTLYACGSLVQASNYLKGLEVKTGALLIRTLLVNCLKVAFGQSVPKSSDMNGDFMLLLIILPPLEITLLKRYEVCEALLARPLEDWSKMVTAFQQMAAKCSGSIWIFTSLQSFRNISVALGTPIPTINEAWWEPAIDVTEQTRQTKAMSFPTLRARLDFLLEDLGAQQLMNTINPCCLGCHAYVTGEIGVLPSKGFKNCSGCHAAMYCSSECQVADWKAGHSKKCHGRKAKRAKQGKTALAKGDE